MKKAQEWRHSPSFWVQDDRPGELALSLHDDPDRFLPLQTVHVDGVPRAICPKQLPAVRVYGEIERLDARPGYDHGHVGSVLECAADGVRSAVNPIDDIVHDVVVNREDVVQVADGQEDVQAIGGLEQHSPDGVFAAKQ